MPVDAVLATASSTTGTSKHTEMSASELRRIQAALRAAILTTILLSGYMVAVG